MLNHSPLNLITILLGAFIVVLTGCGPHIEPMDESSRRVNVEQFEQFIEAGDAVLLDVRTPEEFTSGHIHGATNLDIRSANFVEAIRGLDTNQAYLVYCRSGARSQRACSMMESAGITQIHELAPGILGWESAGKPVAR